MVSIKPSGGGAIPISKRTTIKFSCWSNTSRGQAWLQIKPPPQSLVLTTISYKIWSELQPPEMISATVSDLQIHTRLWDSKIYVTVRAQTFLTTDTHKSKLWWCHNRATSSNSSIYRLVPTKQTSVCLLFFYVIFIYLMLDFLSTP